MRPVFALASVVVFALAGCDSSSFRFNATNTIPAGSGGINLNDEIAVRFNQELDGESVSVEAVRVTDEAGRRLPVRARTSGDVLFVAPADADGWPAETRLTVEIPHPWLGRPIRSGAGVPNGAPFRAEVTTGRRFGSRGGALKLAYHSLPFSGGTDVTPEAEFLFDFDGPIDPESLEGAVQMQDLTRSEAVGGVGATAVSARRLAIAPFAGQDFRPGTRYRLTLAATILSLDSRRLGAPVSFVFTTTRSRSGQFTTTFAPSQLVDPSLKPDKGPLTPQLAILETPPLGLGVANGRAEPFCRDPSRVQILIPGDRLPLQTGLITAMSLKVFGIEAASLRLSARLDYAADAHSDQLSRSFDDNWHLPGPRDLLGHEGEVRLLVPEDGTLNLRFLKPFLYEVGPDQKRRSLVLEIANESGILNESAGIELRGEDVSRNLPARFLSARGDWFGDGERQHFVPALSLVVQGYRPVALQPWTTESFAEPEYFRRQDDVLATPGFYAYRVEFRRFVPGMDPASEDDENGYTTNLRELEGSRTIQARIVFQLRSADPVPKDAGLLRLTVPFRERGE
jgi:Bacterial Ig-like domain